MTSLTVDSSTLRQFESLADLTELRDRSGRVVGYFYPSACAAGLAPTMRPSPFTDDELRRRQQQRCGKPLSELLGKLSS
jgi:hypothetical protein